MKTCHLGTFPLVGVGKVWKEDWMGYRDLFDDIRWTRADCARHLPRFFGEPDYSATIHRFRGNTVGEARQLLGIVTAWVEYGRSIQGGCPTTPDRFGDSVPEVASTRRFSPISCSRQPPV